jgi:hypothetical protein
VSVDDERGLRERLDRAFTTIVPAPAPVERAVRRGKRIRVRRRAAAAAGVAAVVAAGVFGISALAHQSATPAPATTPSPVTSPGGHTVTVQQPSPHAAAGLIASGTIDGQDWKVVADQPGTHRAGPGRQNIRFQGSVFGDAQSVEVVPALHADSAVPVAFGAPFGGIGNSPAAVKGSPQVQYGAVRADVSYVTVKLGNGTMLTLHPATVYGTRAIAFAVPEDLTIVSVTAYSRGGEIATAIPFNYQLGPAYFGVWLSPGQAGNLRASYPAGAGTFEGAAWSATAHTGPWGVCLTASSGGIGGAGCATATGPATGILFNTIGFRSVACGVAAPSVVRLVVHRPDGSSVQVRPVTAGDQKVFAFAMSRPGPHALSWTAYDRSGAVVAYSPAPAG